MQSEKDALEGFFPGLLQLAYCRYLPSQRNSKIEPRH
jgi:hypothetical protein